jgi:hypothetical protein
MKLRDVFRRSIDWVRQTAGKCRTIHLSTAIVAMLTASFLIAANIFGWGWRKWHFSLRIRNNPAVWYGFPVADKEVNFTSSVRAQNLFWCIVILIGMTTFAEWMARRRNSKPNASSTSSTPP